jgi:hypothetical protein
MSQETIRYPLATAPECTLTDLSEDRRLFCKTAENSSEDTEDRLELLAESIV